MQSSYFSTINLLLAAKYTGWGVLCHQLKLKATLKLNWLGQCVLCIFDFCSAFRNRLPFKYCFPVIPGSSLIKCVDLVGVETWMDFGEILQVIRFICSRETSSMDSLSSNREKTRMKSQLDSLKCRHSSLCCSRNPNWPSQAENLGVDYLLVVAQRNYLPPLWINYYHKYEIITRNSSVRSFRSTVTRDANRAFRFTVEFTELFPFLVTHLFTPAGLCKKGLVC